MVYLKRILSRGTAYYALAESVRDGAKVRTNILRSLGPLTDEEAEYWRKLLYLPAHDVMNLETLQRGALHTYQSYRHGVVALVHALWHHLGFHSIILRSLNGVSNKGRTAKILEVLVANRLESPKSDLGVLEWFPQTSLPFILGVKPELMYDNLLYRTLSVLWKQRDLIEKRIWEEIVKPQNSSLVVGKDITSSYFEGRGPPMAGKGYSRDHRRDCRQVNWGLVVTEEGYPITLEVYPGNTPDKATVEDSCKRLKGLFGIDRAIFVGDRSTCTGDNVEVIRGHNYDYIVAETNTNVQEILDEAKKREWECWDEQSSCQRVLPGFEPPDQVMGVNIDVNGSRYVVAKSSEKMRDDLETLSNNLIKGEIALQQVKKYAKTHQKVHHHKILQMAVKRLEKLKISKYFDLHWNEPGGFAYTLTAKVDQEREHAGIWVLQTSLETIPGSTIIHIYKELWRIEHAFREIKSVLLVRPIGHQRDDRTEVHIWICVLAYLLERMVEEKVRKMGIDLTGQGVFESFRNLTLNEQGVDNLEKRWWSVTELGVHQKNILSALGLKENMLKIQQSLLPG